MRVIPPDDTGYGILIRDGRGDEYFIESTPKGAHTAGSASGLTIKFAAGEELRLWSDDGKRVFLYDKVRAKWLLVLDDRSLSMWSEGMQNLILDGMT